MRIKGKISGANFCGENRRFTLFRLLKNTLRNVFSSILICSLYMQPRFPVVSSPNKSPPISALFTPLKTRLHSQFRQRARKFTLSSLLYLIAFQSVFQSANISAIQENLFQDFSTKGKQMIFSLLGINSVKILPWHFSSYSTYITDSLNDSLLLLVSQIRASMSSMHNT